MKLLTVVGYKLYQEVTGGSGMGPANSSFSSTLV